MQTDWLNETKKLLKENELVRKSYHLELDSHEGYITLTDERLIFLQVKGFLKKSYNKILDLPYNKIISIEHNNDHKFTLNSKNDKKFIFSTIGIPASIVEKSIEYFHVHFLDISLARDRSFVSSKKKGPQVRMVKGVI